MTRDEVFRSFIKHISSIFGYRPLQSPTEIRLLEVEKRGESCHFRARNFELEECPPYEAISYVWGSGPRNCGLCLKDSTTVLMLTANAYSTLAHLAPHCSTGYLWMDQACINQDDAEERGAQVQMMGSIFKNCERVIVSLSNYPLSAGCLQFMKDVHQEYTSRMGPDMYYDKAVLEKIPESTMKMVLTSYADDLGKHLNELRWLYQLPWYRRAWVVQEVVLPKECFILIGNTSIDLRCLADVGKGISLWTDRDSMWNIGALFRMWYHREYRNNYIDACFLDKISAHSRCTHATDKRDLIYAYLGLHDGQNFNLVSNYNLTVREVYLVAAREMIRECKSLDILREVRPSIDPQQKELPTWAPDWSEPLACVPFSDSAKYTKLKSCRGREHLVASPSLIKWPSILPYNDNPSDLLVVRGKSINQIFSMVRRTRSYKTRFDIPNLWDGAIAHAQLPFYMSRLRSVRPSMRSKLCRERVLKVLLGGCVDFTLSHPDQEDSHDNAEVISYMLKVYDEMSSKKELHQMAIGNNDVGRFERAAHVLGQKDLFVTKDEKLGLVHSSARRGDKIAVLHGSKVPIVLREYGESFKVIGECYLEDAMYGESCTWPEEEADVIFLS